MGKKRRADAVDLDAERTLYSSFVCAANSMSQLYSQALQQQRKSSAAASRQALERVVAFTLRPEYASTDVIPKSAILQFLQQEYENLEGELPQTFPVFPLQPASGGSQQSGGQQQGQQGGDAAAAEHHHHAHGHQQHHVQQPEVLKPAMARVGGHHMMSQGSGLLSPSAKRANSATTSPSPFSAMDTADHEASTMLQPGQLLGVPHQGLGGSVGGALGVLGGTGTGGQLHEGVGARSGMFGGAGFTAC